MKQTLQLKTSQHLALTPQLQQSIRLLQLSTLELHQEIEQVLSDNPLLERLDDPLDRSVRLLADGAINSAPSPRRGEAPAAPASGEQDGAPAERRGRRRRRRRRRSAAATSDDADWGDAGRSGSGGGEDEDGRPQLEASPVTLREHLMEQVRLTCMRAARLRAGRTGRRCAGRQRLPGRIAGRHPRAPAGRTGDRVRGTAHRAGAGAKHGPAPAWARAAPPNAWRCRSAACPACRWSRGAWR